MDPNPVSTTVRDSFQIGTKRVGQKLLKQQFVILVGRIIDHHHLKEYLRISLPKTCCKKTSIRSFINEIIFLKAMGLDVIYTVKSTNFL